ncbi:Sum1 [Kluyveromyces lactis]|nr:Sum1 [Kluyveromyces lactis]
MDSDTAMTGHDDNNGEIGIGENGVSRQEKDRSVVDKKDENGISSVQAGLESQRGTIRELEKKVSEIESILPETDEIIQKSIESVVVTLRNLSHNQQVLETKFEDLLKNQVNSDAAINDLSVEIIKINRLLSDRSTMSATSGASSGTIGSAAYGSPAYISSASVSPPHRGPGRPPKKNTSILSNGDKKAKLPFPSDHISKSKRLFLDPSKEKAESNSGYDADGIGNSRSRSSANVKQETPQEPKKRRGRPSKKSTWEAQLTSSQKKTNAADNDTKERQSSSSRRKSQRLKSGSRQYDEQSDLSSSFSGMSDNEGQDDEGDITDDQKQVANDVHDSRSRKQKELEMKRDERERMLVTMKYSDRNVTRNFMELNKDLFMAMKQEERKKRMTAVPFSVPVPLGKYQLSSKHLEELSKVPFSLSQTAENSSGAQSPSSNPPDSARSLTPQTIVSAYNTLDQPGNVSSVSKASADDVSGQNLSLLNSEHKDVNDSVKRTSSDIGDRSQMFNEAEGPRKVRILSILNDDASTGMKTEENVSDRPHLLDMPNSTPQGSADALPSSQFSVNSTENSQDNFSITTLQSGGESPNKKRHLTLHDRRKMSRMIPMLPEKKDKRGRPSSNNQSQENAASLLMSSPVELYCREGFFYRKGSTIPITAGEYLDLKFRHKEDELIKLTMHEEDYAELTRQDRINAYFLKPDVEIETSMACQVLSNVILTERYVNSLEYFLMEFRWENRLVSLGLKLRESKRTWQRRKALFALFEFWRDKSKDKRGFHNYTLLHSIKEMENYRVFINRSVSWFYNHITLLKMILFDLCDNTNTHWREWMFARGSELPLVGKDGVDVMNINREIDNILVLDFLEDGSKNSNKKSSSIPYKENSEGPLEQPYVTNDVPADKGAKDLHTEHVEQQSETPVPELAGNRTEENTNSAAGAVAVNQDQHLPSLPKDSEGVNSTQ